MSFVSVSTYSYVHSLTYVTDMLLLSLKELIHESGLSPEKLTGAWHWATLHRGIRTWLDTRDLTRIILEVDDPRTGTLIGRWDFDIDYELENGGTMWVDTDDIKYHIMKAGRWPSHCDYRIVVSTKPGRPDVEGWAACTLRSTEGFIRHSIGTTLNGNGLGARAAYWKHLA